MILRPVLLLVASAPVVLSLNILIFLLGTQQSERANMEMLAQSLALRHHTVVSVKPILIPEEPRLVKPKLHMVREKTMKNLLPRTMYRPLEEVYNGGPWRVKYDYDEYMEPYYAAHNYSCGRILNSDLMDGLAKDKIDVAIVYNGNPCQLALCHVLGIPVMYYDTDGLTDETLVAAGAPASLAFPLSHCRIAAGFQQFSNPLMVKAASSLCILNELVAQSGIASLASLVSKRFRLMDGPITRMFAEDYTLKKRFSSFPDVNTLKQSAAMYLANTDPLLEWERPLPSHVFPVGGMHIDLPKPLFSPWSDAVEASEQGTIVVSFGTHINGSAMSATQASAIYGALSALTGYRVMWSVGPSIALPGISAEKTLPHINITAFLPQNDILADKKTRLLITNGGMNSLMEAVAHGVPVVGIPLYGSNQANLEKVAHKGLGVIVTKGELSQTTLLKAIKTVLEGSKYKATAKDMAREFKARQQKSSVFERLVHIIEHVGKHRGAAFFRPQERPVSRFLSLPLEVLAFLVVIFGAPLFLAYVITAKTIGFLVRGFKSSVPAPSPPAAPKASKTPTLPPKELTKAKKTN